MWEVSPNVGREKNPIFLAFFFPFYFLIIFLDDFISKKGVGDRRRTGGGRTQALRRAEEGAGARDEGGAWRPRPLGESGGRPVQTGRWQHYLLIPRGPLVQPGFAGEGLLGASLWGMTSLPHGHRREQPSSEVSLLHKPLGTSRIHSGQPSGKGSYCRMLGSENLLKSHGGTRWAHTQEQPHKHLASATRHRPAAHTGTALLSQKPSSSATALDGKQIQGHLFPGVVNF